MLRGNQYKTNADVSNPECKASAKSLLFLALTLAALFVCLQVQLWQMTFNLVFRVSKVTRARNRRLFAEALHSGLETSALWTYTIIVVPTIEIRHLHSRPTPRFYLVAMEKNQESSGNEASMCMIRGNLGLGSLLKHWSLVDTIHTHFQLWYYYMGRIFLTNIE